MNSIILPVRKDIHDCLKNSPWASEQQFEAIWAYLDHQLAGRGRGRQALQRAGMVDFSDRTMGYWLDRSQFHLTKSNETLQRRLTKIDRRRIHQISLDDTMNRRYGKDIYGAAYQYNHSHGNVSYGQTLVDLVVCTDHLLGVDYELYLPKKYLQRTNGSLDDFSTKIRLGNKLLEERTNFLLDQGFSPTKIWVSNDCWYSSKQLTTQIRRSGVNFVQGLKKDARSHWFGQTARLDEIFNHLQKWYYRTDPVSGKNVYFQEKILTLVNHWRCKVVAIRSGEDKRIRYYATSVLKITIDRLLRRLKTHWRVETMHRDLKELCHLNGCNSDRQNLNHLHWLLCYLTYFLLRQYQYRPSRKGIEVTIPYLFNHYYYSYDESRTRHCFSSPSRRLKLQRRLVTF